jgi:hypothetical protein
MPDGPQSVQEHLRSIINSWKSKFIKSMGGKSLLNLFFLHYLTLRIFKQQIF